MGQRYCRRFILCTSLADMDGDLKRAMSGMWAELDTDPSSELTKAAIPGLFRWMNLLDSRKRLTALCLCANARRSAQVDQVSF